MGNPDALPALRICAVLLAVGASAALDDTAEATVSCCPTPRAFRHLVHLAPVALSVGSAWVLALGIASLDMPEVPIGGLTLELLVLLVVVWSVASFGVRLRGAGAGALVAGPVLLGFVGLLTRMPPRSAMFVPAAADARWGDSRLRWAALGLLCLCAFVLTLRDPVDTAVLRRS